MSDIPRKTRKPKKRKTDADSGEFRRKASRAVEANLKDLIKQGCDKAWAKRGITMKRWDTKGIKLRKNIDSNSNQSMDNL